MATLDNLIPPALVSTQWLAEHLDEPTLAVIDASWHMPAENKDAREEFYQAHIPGAVFFDLDQISDPGSELPHMLPSAEHFSEAISALGIQNNMDIVVYDTKGMFSAPRARWMFRAFGHNRVTVLDGGLPAWRKHQHPLNSNEAVTSTRPAKKFLTKLNPSMVRSKSQVLANLELSKEQLVDARSAGRFKGSDPEPRPGLPSGHIPNSLNLPFNQLIDPEIGLMLPPAQLQRQFKSTGIDLSRPIVTSCGSGVTACIIALALEQLGKTDVAVYDGSWAEWGAANDTPIATD